MKIEITAGVLMFLLACGFVIVSCDGSDNCIKLFSEDDYIDSEIEEMKPIKERQEKAIALQRKLLGYDKSNLNNTYGE